MLSDDLDVDGCSISGSKTRWSHGTGHCPEKSSGEGQTGFGNHHSLMCDVLPGDYDNLRIQALLDSQAAEITGCIQYLNGMAVSGDSRWWSIHDHSAY